MTRLTSLKLNIDLAVVPSHAAALHSSLQPLPHLHYLSRYLPNDSDDINGWNPDVDQQAEPEEIDADPALPLSETVAKAVGHLTRLDADHPPQPATEVIVSDVHITLWILTCTCTVYIRF